MIALVLALAVTVEPAFLPCRPSWGTGATVIDAQNPDVTGDRHVAVELADYVGHVAEVELDLPARSHKRVVVFPALVAGRVNATLREEDGTRTPLASMTRPPCRGPAIAALARDDGRTGFALPGDIGGVPIESGTLTREDLAGSARPLVALDAIAAEARALHELSDAELGMIMRFVRNGGVLVIVPGIDPGPFFASARAPRGMAAAPAWQSSRMGAGFVVVNADPSSGDPRLGGILAVSDDTRERWAIGVNRILDAQRDRAGPAGRTSRPAGVLSLGICLFAAAAAHELLRRKFVVGTREFARYFQGLGIVLGVASVSGIVAAFVSRDPGSSRDLVIAHSTGLGTRSRAIVLGSGKTRTLAEGAWAYGEREIRYVMGARNAAVNDGARAGVVLERSWADLDGTVSMVPEPQRDSIRNDTAIPFERGWIVNASGCSAVPALGPGEEARHSFGMCPTDPEFRQVMLATDRGLSWYVTRSGGVLYAISLEQP